MAGIALKTLVHLGLIMGLVAGCEPGAGGRDMASAPLAAGDADGVAPATSVRLVDHDVEAPQDFQVTDKALWDGRPSLGGVWVAATSVSDPMRVIMRNPSNGKFVIGALFRREADNPGPKLQISSDAADALGLVAGEPAMLNVTALRREEAPVQVPDASKPLLDTPETLAGADVAAAADAAITAAPVEPAPAPALPATRPTTRPAAQVQPVAAATPAASTSAGTASIQIGIFSMESNANRAVATLAKAGITATVRPETSHGKPLWSVIAAGDASLLAKIRQAGFKDAYFIKR
ncbi:MAG: SPOR domain-containing protein [Pseudorhodobacter sp.]|nr:SPOR domain-containing protein [Pseudorhodobacter sp.]